MTLLLLEARIPTPWRAMMTSGPVWAIVSAHVLHNYTNYTMLTSLPTFMKEVLKFDIRQVKHHKVYTLSSDQSQHNAHRNLTVDCTAT